MNKKDAENFAGQKREKTGKTHPVWAKKGETGCVLGAGGDESGKNRLRTDARGRHRMQHKPGKLDRIQTSLSTKNPQTMRFSQGLGTRILAGAEGLGLACRLGRLVACVPPARTRPTTRGFGVDVGERSRQRGRSKVEPSSRTSSEKVVLVWCCGEKSGPKHLKFCGGENKEKAFHSSSFKVFSNSGKSPWIISHTSLRFTPS